MMRFTLRELLKIKNGKDHKNLSDGKIPVFGSGGLMRYVDDYLFDKESILLPRKGSLNNIQYVNTPFWTVDTLYYTIVDTKKANVYYLYNLIKLFDLSKLNSGTGVPSMTFDAYYDIEVELPSLSTQNRIADVLSALDFKIELNNRINAELEAMAKTIYDYWFVQFDFPNVEGKPYKSSGGKMVWCEKLNREVPEGWKTEKMSEWVDIDKSGDWGKEELEGNFTKKVICFRGADINGLNGLAELKPPVRYILEKNSSKILKSHDLIIEISGGSPTQSTGRLAFITDATIKRFEHPLICSNFCKPISIRNKKLLYNFVFYWNSLYDNGVFFGYEGKTSGIKNLLLDSFLSSYSTVVPDEKVVNQFYDMMESIQEKKQTALSENQQLSSLRDWLLPMLMNGQVKVKEVEEVETLIAAEPKTEFKCSKSQWENYHKIESVYAILWANKQLAIQQGEMALAKDTYLIDKIAGLNTGFTFAQHNWGSYDPTFKKIINNKQYFVRRNFENSKATYFDLNDNEKLIDKIPDIIKESVRKTIEELDKKVFGKYHWHQKAEMKELYATVLKCIEDTQSIDLAVIRQTMKDWKTPKQDFPDKAAKFSEAQTKEALYLIVKEGWELKVIKDQY